jgi:phosphoribosylamine--glycine ligase
VASAADTTALPDPLIAALPAAEAPLFHAGTALEDGRLASSGGRVLDVCGLGASLAAARRAAYTTVDATDWPDGFCRRDIGWRALRRDGG